MNKTYIIERNGERIVIMTGHDTQYVVGSKLKYGSGKAWVVVEVCQ
jgi:hypothetical protein